MPDSYSGDETTRELQAIRDMPNDSAISVAMNALISEIKSLSRQIQQMGVTLNAHVTKLAVSDVQRDNQDKLLASLTARIATLEDERAELTKAILAKAAMLCSGLAALIAAMFAYFTKGTP
jgi:hypothetical protein